ncbi:MAG: FAD-dependent oxidoreductase [Pseudooceanicola sp.]|jgi:D-arginine dehydrogenase|nr:FAD-dependent oxidoreductase [Pseudooceanicola sp.]
MANTFDVIVIGAGIAGTSVAAELSTDQRVLLLERESQPGYHTTGRSAALFTVTYGPPVIRALSRASQDFFNAPSHEYVDHPLLAPRGTLFIAREDQLGQLTHLAEELGDAVTPISAEEAVARLPLLRPGHIVAALEDTSAADIEVASLHQHYLKFLRANGGEIATKAEVTGLAQSGDSWTVTTPGATYSAATVVNAAGAWADEIASLAGVSPVGLTPKRRTAMIVAPPAGMVPDAWPMVVDADEEFYVKPDAGKLLMSPADATPSAPCDAQPEEMDVAICIDRVTTALDLPVRRIEHKWAGLRSFLPDGDPLATYDAQAPGFFWLAGQGGYGIQTAPALARTAAALIRRQDVPADIAAHGVNAGALTLSRKDAAA